MLNNWMIPLCLIVALCGFGYWVNTQQQPVNDNAVTLQATEQQAIDAANQNANQNNPTVIGNTHDEEDKEEEHGHRTATGHDGEHGDEHKRGGNTNTTIGTDKDHGDEHQRSASGKDHGDEHQRSASGKDHGDEHKRSANGKDHGDEHKRSASGKDHGDEHKRSANEKDHDEHKRTASGKDHGDEHKRHGSLPSVAQR